MRDPMLSSSVFSPPRRDCRPVPFSAPSCGRCPLSSWWTPGDVAFLKHARAMYDQTIRENTVNPFASALRMIVNCYWNTPTLPYCLDGFRNGGDPKS